MQKSSLLNQPFKEVSPSSGRHAKQLCWTLQSPLTIPADLQIWELVARRRLLTSIWQSRTPSSRTWPVYSSSQCSLLTQDWKMFQSSCFQWGIKNSLECRHYSLFATVSFRQKLLLGQYQVFRTESFTAFQRSMQKPTPDDDIADAEALLTSEK